MAMQPLFPVDTYLPFMRDVSKCEQSLHELNLIWRMIESSAKMTYPREAQAILPTIAATRAGFSQLEQELVTSLVHEKIGNVQAELAAKAQYVIEIVVRNLYERTADVGFLATDRQLCAFVAGLNDDAEAIRLRLRAYRSKYTVYDEIMLLDLSGNVLAQIDESNPVERSFDPLVVQALASDNYVETFRANDLQPGKRNALIYTRRIHHPDTDAIVGVLCLCFAFEEEMACIFQTHRDHMERSIMLLLDADNCVIASADLRWIPLGARVPVNHGAESGLLMYAGRQYLVRTHASIGYQGYPGPVGWQGQLMIPIDVAFSSNPSAILADLDPDIAGGLLSHADSFCPPLSEIMSAAETIRRVVWNGQVMTAGQDGELTALKTILEQISETGARSNELFAKSIRELYETVLASSLRDCRFMSHLLVDLLDRNLYERANDCRWWALSPELRMLLAGQRDQHDSVARIAAILEYINGLYTVYTTIAVYDRDGQIVASSDVAQLGEAKTIDQRTLREVLALRTEQDYYVTPFEATPLYGDQPTYVYHAAIRHPDDDMQIIGGIGIVFDAGPEFAAMLRGGIGDRRMVDAFFVDRAGLIIASTDQAHPIGTTLSIDAEILKMNNGDGTARILIHDDQYAITGFTVSNGYREFKVNDGYCADVIAVVITSFGAVREGNASGKDIALLENTNVSKGGSKFAAEFATEFATFIIDGNLFAIAAEHVEQALPAVQVASVSLGSSTERVGILALGRHRDEDAEHYVWVFDLKFFLSGKMTLITSASQVVIVKHGTRSIGLLVNELHGVAKFDQEQMIDTPLAGGTNGMLVRQVIKANQGSLLIQVVDTDYLFSLMADPDTTR